MECKHCGSKNSQAISEYVEIERKPFSLLLVISLMVGIFCILTGLGMLVSSCQDTNEEIDKSNQPDNIVYQSSYQGIEENEVSEAASKILLGTVGKYVLVFGTVTCLFVALIRIVQPYRHITKTKIICLDCGAILFEQEVISDEDASE
ncbi:MAG: hypothetical protein IKB98_03420 [Clostridia bacterium]|nr:hypothetical protein [Clostridia bacterium]